MAKNRQIKINGKSYRTKPFESELLFAAVVDVANDVSNAEKQNRFVESIIPQIEGLEPNNIAVRRGDNWVLNCDGEQWYEWLLHIQLIAFRDLADKAVKNARPLAEIKAAKELIRTQLQAKIFNECMDKLDENWLDKVAVTKQEPEYLTHLAAYWEERTRAYKDVPQWITDQLDAIPNAYKKNNAPQTSVIELND